VVPPGVPDWHYDEVTQFFVDGRAAMTTDWPGGYHLFKNPAISKVADRFGVALYPVGPSGKRFVYSGGHTFAIPRSVRNLERSLSLLRFLTSEDSQHFEATLGALPARSAIQARIQADTPPGSLDARRLDLLRITVENHMLIPPKFSQYPAVEDILWTSVQAAIVGEMDIDTALQQAAHQSWKIMNNPEDHQDADMRSDDSTS
jgi:multiple sugar transport system substrate-binding protein